MASQRGRSVEDRPEDRGDPSGEIGLRRGEDAVLDAVGVGQAGEAPPPFAVHDLKHECRRRARPLVAVDPDFGCRRHAVARHQIVPAGQREKSVARGGVEQGEQARSAVAENRGCGKLASAERYHATPAPQPHLV